MKLCESAAMQLVNTLYSLHRIVVTGQRQQWCFFYQISACWETFQTRPSITTVQRWLDDVSSKRRHTVDASHFIAEHLTRWHCVRTSETCYLCKLDLSRHLSPQWSQQSMQLPAVHRLPRQPYHRGNGYPGDGLINNCVCLQVDEAWRYEA